MQRSDLKEIAIVGLGLIGGSFFKAAQKAGYNVRGIDRNDPVEVSNSDLVIIALHPTLTVKWLLEHAADLKKGALTIDVCGVKSAVIKELAPKLNGSFTFIGGHPMAGKEVSGFENSDAELFRGASMILTPFPQDQKIAEDIVPFFTELGFKEVVFTTPEDHDKRIAYTSQLCHIVSSAYLRDELALKRSGFSAGSFRDLSRVGAPDPELWSELFLMNKTELLPVLKRMIKRLTDFQTAIANDDRESLVSQLAEGQVIKEKLQGEEK